MVLTGCPREANCLNGESRHYGDPKSDQRKQRKDDTQQVILQKESYFSKISSETLLLGIQKEQMDGEMIKGWAIRQVEEREGRWVGGFYR